MSGTKRAPEEEPMNEGAPPTATPSSSEEPATKKAKLSEAEAGAPPTYDLNGSCHCGAVKFKVTKVDVTKIGKCNCTICNKTGTAEIALKPDVNDLILEQDNGKETVVTMDNCEEAEHKNLGHYQPNREKYVKGVNQACHHFCKNCGVHTFISLFFKEMGGLNNYVNVRTLDVKGHGLDLKELTKPENVTYANGLRDTWEMRKGEPWDEGVW